MRRATKWIMRPVSNPTEYGNVPLYSFIKDKPGIHPLIKKIAQRRTLNHTWGRPNQRKSIDERLPVQKENTILSEIAAVFEHARDTKKTILVWGDYDVDGMTATAVMVHTLKHLKYDVRWGVPNRLTTGYGIDVDSIKIITHGLDPKSVLIITVDTGIAEVEEVKTLKKLGYEIIVTDHHLPEGDLPDCIVYNTKLYYKEGEEDYVISGCNAAVRVMEEVYIKTKGGEIDPEVSDFWACMESMSIISDVIDINALTRVILLDGLVKLRQTTHDGLRALLTLCGVKEFQPISATTLSYTVIPKLNAAGRMGNPRSAVQLLLLSQDDSVGKASSLLMANELIAMNTDRKLIESRIYDEAESMGFDLIKKFPYGLVVYNEGWHPGVLGIIAARMVDRFNVPVIVISDDKGTYKGSGRGIDGFDLFGTLEKCKEHLIKFGGHMAAAGVEVIKEELPKFQETFNEICRQSLNSTSIIYEIDSEVAIPTLHDVRFQIGMRILEPYGKENPEPVFKISDLKVISAEMKRDALAIIAIDDRDNGIYLTKYRPPEEWKIQPGTFIHVLVTPSNLYFSGSTTLEWKIKDLKVIGTPIPETTQRTFP